MQNQESISIGQAARLLLKDFRFWVNTFSTINKMNQQVGHGGLDELEEERYITQGTYHMGKSFVDDLLDAEDMSPFIKIEYKEKIKDIYHRKDRGLLYDKSDLIRFQKILAAPHEVLIEGIQRSKEQYKCLVEQFETARGWK